MEIPMKIYFVQYCWKEIIEVVYEYIISICENVFQVVNEVCTLYIEPDPENQSLLVALRHDDNEKFCMDYLSNHNLENTGMKYVQIFNHDSSGVIKKRNSSDFIANNEIMYIKLNYNEISRLLITIVSKLLNLKKYFSVMIPESADSYTIYISKTDFEYEMVKCGDSSIRLVDKTASVVGKFL